MVLSCHNIFKSFGEQTVLENCSFHIEEYDKAAIVGINGAGKSTLLKIIAGELSADSGTCIVAKDKQLVEMEIKGSNFWQWSIKYYFYKIIF